MEIHTIKTKQEYKIALEQIDKLLNFQFKIFAKVSF